MYNVHLSPHSNIFTKIAWIFTARIIYPGYIILLYILVTIIYKFYRNVPVLFTVICVCKYISSTVEVHPMSRSMCPSQWTEKRSSPLVQCTSLPFFPKSYLFLIMHIYVYLCAHGAQKRVLNTLELKLQIVMSLPHGF